MLLNPGGPGGSGVSIAIRLGSLIQDVIDLEQDVIGFDPRGIGATTPRADCFSYPFEGSGPDAEEDQVRAFFTALFGVAQGDKSESRILVLMLCKNWIFKLGLLRSSVKIKTLCTAMIAFSNTSILLVLREI